MVGRRGSRREQMVGTSLCRIIVARGAGSDAKLLNRHNGQKRCDLSNSIYF